MMMMMMMMLLCSQKQKRIQGDCDSDSDCTATAGLKCYQRSGTESVPGCTGTARSEVDYCILDGDDDDGQNNNDITDVGGDQEEDGDLLARCEGDCDSDAECAEGLVCYQREDDEPVPRCNGSARTGWDYCVRESDLDLLEEMMDDVDEEEVEEEEVEEVAETPRPTMRPTMPPPGVVFSYPDGTEPDDMQRCHGDCDKGKLVIRGAVLAWWDLNWMWTGARCFWRFGME